MGRRRAVVCGIAGILLGLCSRQGHSEEPYKTIPPGTAALLDEAEAIELISLDPRERPANPGESFHNWKVLGRTSIRGANERQAIVGTLKRGVAEADKVAGCFEPRHGLRATKGEWSADLVICFSCGWIEVHDGGKTSSVWISQMPKPAFNKALRGAGVPLAQDVEGP